MKTSVNLLLIFSQLAVSLNAQLCEKPVDIPAGQSTVLNATQELSNDGECFWNLTTAANYKLNVTCSIEYKPTNCESTEGAASDTNANRLLFSVQGNDITIKQENKGINTVDFFCDVTSSEEKKCECGRIPAHISNNNQTRIFGGVEAEKHEFPSMAELYKNEMIWCGAVIISTKVLLTASECFDGESVEYKVLVGAHLLNETDDGEFYRIVKFTNHGIFSIALFEVEKSIKFSDKIGAACLPFSISKGDLIGRFVTAAGWGRTEKIGLNNADILMKVDLEIVEDKVCASVYSNGYDESKHLCANTPEKSANFWDDGGPLYYIKNNRYYLVGIIDYERLGKPLSNFNVNYFLSWIKESLKGEEFCEM